jgi:hypothetical protein
MAKQRLFPESPTSDKDKREPHQKFDDLAARVLSVPKSEIDQREKHWRRTKNKSKA